MPEVTDPSLLAQLNGGRTPQPIISLPDVDKQQDNARADAQRGLRESGEARAGRGEQRDISNTAFQQTQSLRTAYEATPEIKNYRVVVPQLIDALKTPADASGDNALLYAYSKIMDPGSVVRESETASAASGASVFDQTVANLKKHFGIEGGGQLTPDIREGLKRQALARTQELGRIYRAQRQRYTEDASAYGIDPMRVIGRDDFEPYLADFERLQGRGDNAQGAAQTSGGVNNPEMRGGLPVGTDIQFNMDKPETPFDRNAYLQQNYGINGDQEAQMVAFWNQNRNNPGLTVQAAKQWFQAQGIPAPSDSDIANTIGQLRKGYQIGSIDTSGAEQAYTQRLDADLAKQGFDPNSAGAYAQRAAQGLEFGLGDELEGIGGAIGNLFSNEGVADGYTYNRDLQRRAFEQSRDAQGLAGDAAELAGGLVGGGITASRAPLSAARALREGAVGGALAGYGYGEGLPGSALGAVAGGAAGAGLGYGIGRGAEAVAARRAAQPASQGADVIRAADNLNSQFGTNISPTPADVGGVTTRRASGVAAQLPLSAGSVVRGSERVSAEAKSARDAISRLVGNASTDEAAGDAALEGAKKYIKSSQTKVNSLYSQAERLGGKEPVDLANARQVLDQNISELSQTPGGAPGLDRLQRLRATLDQPYPVDGVKRMRSTLRDEFLSDGLRNTDLERRVGQVVDAAELDVVDSLAAAGKGDAVKAYQEAAAAHKERVGIIDDVLEPFIGRDGSKSVEDVMKAIDTATKTKGARLGKFLQSLPDEDASTVRATIISKLGRSSAGRQDDTGDAFSLGQFLTHWNQISGPAKSQLFGGEVRSALDDLAKVSSGTKESQRYANFSNTGSVIGGLVTGAGLPSFFYAPITTTVGLASQYGAGKLLASPKFARWLAKMPTQPGAIERHVNALSKIAANDNAIAADIAGLQQALEGVLGQSSRAAAAPTPSTSSNPQGERR